MLSEFHPSIEICTTRVDVSNLEAVYRYMTLLVTDGGHAPRQFPLGRLELAPHYALMSLQLHVRCDDLLPHLTTEDSKGTESIAYRCDGPRVVDPFAFDVGKHFSASPRAPRFLHSHLPLWLRYMRTYLTRLGSPA